MAQNFDLRQSELRSALPMVGSLALATADAILFLIDPELSKLFEDRNVLLTDGGLIAYTGTQVQFTENLRISINSKVAGGSPTVISLGSATQTLANNDIFYAVLNRTGGTATVAIAASLPAVTAADQEVFLIAKRVDAGDGTQRLYWRNGMAINAGQTVRLGASGSGSGETGAAREAADGFSILAFEDLSVLPTDPASYVDTTRTTATYDIVGGIYRALCDKSVTVTTVGTSYTLSSAPSFTVAVNNIIYSGGTWRRVATVLTTTTGTLDVAFTPDLTAAVCMVSQAVFTKDIVNTGDAVQKTRPRDFFPSTTVPIIHVDYADSLTVADYVADRVDPARVAVSATNSELASSVVFPDSDRWTPIFKRPEAPNDVPDYPLIEGTYNGTSLNNLSEIVGGADGTRIGGPAAGTASIRDGAGVYFSVPTGGTLITQVGMNLRRIALSGLGVSYYRILGDIGGVPDPSNVFWTSTSIDNNVLPLSPAAFTSITRNPNLTLPAGNYHFTIERFNADGGLNDIEIQSNSAGPIGTQKHTTVGSLFLGLWGFPLYAGNHNDTVTQVGASHFVQQQVTNPSTHGERLFMAFFPNPDEAAVTSTANLLDFEASLYEQETLQNGGFLDSAFAMSDGSGTEVNCSTPVLVGGVTQLTLSFNFTPGINSGSVDGAIEVFVEGQKIPRFVTGIVGAYWKEVSGSTDTIEFWTDLAPLSVSIQVTRRQGVFDSSGENTLRLMAAYDAIVGTAADVTLGKATHSSLQAAHDSVGSAGGRILLLAVTVTETFSWTNEDLMIEGKGAKSILSGNMSMTGDRNVAMHFRVNGNINLTSSDDSFVHLFMSNTGVYTPGGAGNDAVIIQVT